MMMMMIDGGYVPAVKSIMKKPTKLMRFRKPAVVSSKPNYGKEPDLGGPKIARPCSECGKKFWSWKALFGHMRCHPERQWRGINPPLNLRQSIVEVGDLEAEMSEEEEEDQEIASCLLMLANGGVSHKNVRRGCCSFAITSQEGQPEDDDDADVDKRLAIEEREASENKKISNEGVEVMMGHKCSVCLREFSSGQALGGHMRCHREKVQLVVEDDDDDDDDQFSSSITNFFATMEQEQEWCCFDLDLNLPAAIDEKEEEDHRSSCFSYSSSSSSSGPALDLRLGL